MLKKFIYHVITIIPLLTLLFIFGCNSKLSPVALTGADNSTDSGTTISDAFYFSTLRSVDNSATLAFSEAAFSSSNGTGDLAKSDFTPSISGGVATLGGNWSLTKVNTTSYIINFDLQGTSNGSEVVTIIPNLNSIFNTAGEGIMRVPSTITLIDLVWPTYSITLEAEKTITLNFNETVVNSTLNDLSKTDLDVTIVGGVATLGAGWDLTKISSTSYSINLDLQGSTSGAEVVHINMTNNSVFDQGRNVVSSTDEIETLPDETNPTFTISVVAGNIVTLTFNEPVTDELNGDLVKTDLSVSIVGGVATMGAGFALSKTSSSVYIIDLDLQAVPNGSEVVHVDVVDNKVYDAVDMEALSSDKTLNLWASDLRLVGPISMNVNSEITFSATGGSEAGHIYSIISGEGAIGAGTGIFFSGNNAGTTTIRVVDSYSNSENVAIHVGGTGLYAVGGYDGSTMDSVEISFNGADWSYYDNVLPSSHGEAAMKVYKDKLWFVGGYSNSPNVFESSNGTNWINNTNVLPAGADWGSTAVYNGALYYVGGDSNVVYTSTDPANSWNNIGGLNGGSAGGELFFYNNKLWFTDGAAVEWTSDGTTWNAGLSLPGSMNYHAGIVFDNKMWLVGGNSTNVWWSTDGDNWNEGDGLIIPTTRDDGEMATFNGRMWYVAGSSGGYTTSNLSSRDGTTWETHSNVMTVNRDRFALETFTDKTKGPTLGTLAFDNNSFANNDLRNVAYRESNGMIFVSSFGGGIQKSINNGTSWTNVIIADGLPSDNIYSVFIDQADILWAATDNGLGKSADDGVSWTNYSTVDGIVSNTVFDVYIDRNSYIYATTDLGLSISTNGGTAWTTYDSGDGIAANSINDIFVDFNYKIYLATDSGLSISDDNGTSWTTYTTVQGIGSNNVNQVSVGTSGIIYLATDGGLSVSVDSGSSWRNIDTTLGLPTNLITGVTIDNYGIIYVSTQSFGVCISKDGSTNWTTFTTANGLGADIPRKSVISNSGKIYITTSGGLAINQ